MDLLKVQQFKQPPKKMLRKPKTSISRAPFCITQSYNKFTCHAATENMPRLRGSSLNRKKKSAENSPGLSQENSNLQKLLNTPLFDRTNQTAKRSNRKKGLVPKSKLKRSIHVLSRRSATKIREKFTSFYAACDASKYFLTLTFIAPLEDQHAVSVLNKFLTEARKQYGRFEYIWIAERQESGNIHFHMLLNERLDIVKFNALWVLQQYNAGIQHEAYTLAEINQRYHAGTIKDILNPADVKNVNGIDGLSSYLTQYMTKSTSQGDEKPVTFGCRVWHCSRYISRLYTKALTTLEAYNEAGTIKNSYVNEQTGQLYEAKTIVKEYAIIRYIINKKYFSEQYLSELNQVNKWILEGQVIEPPVITYEKYQANYLYLDESTQAAILEDRKPIDLDNWTYQPEKYLMN